MSELLFGIDATLKNLEEKGHTLSWTRKNQFEGCQAQWFLTNICRLAPETIVCPLLREDTYALPGWVIQKLFETYINSRIYRKFGSVDSAMEWFNKNLVLLCETVTQFSYEDQMNIKSVRYFFESEEGKRLIEIARGRGLDPSVEGLQICFVDPCVFARVNKDWDSFYAKISNILRKVLEMWARDGVNLDLMLCESRIDLDLNLGIDTFHIEGFTDYIYNTYGMECFDSIEKLRDGYTLLDGKYNLSRFVHEEQLYLYSTALSIMTGKVPEYMMFLEYKGCRYKAFQFDRGYISRLRESCMRMSSVLSALKSWLTSLRVSDPEQRDFDAAKAPVIFTPNAISCCFCLGRDVCPSFVADKELQKQTANFVGKKAKDRVMKEFESLDPSVINICTF